MPGQQPGILRDLDFRTPDAHRIGRIAHPQAIQAQQRSAPGPARRHMIEGNGSPGARAEPLRDRLRMPFEHIQHHRANAIAEREQGQKSDAAMHGMPTQPQQAIAPRQRHVNAPPPTGKE